MTRPALNGGKECPDLIQLGRGKYYFLLWLKKDFPQKNYNVLVYFIVT
jgi:hypothetical protein